MSVTARYQIDISLRKSSRAGLSETKDTRLGRDHGFAFTWNQPASSPVRLPAPAVETKDDVGSTDIVRNRTSTGSAVQACNSCKMGCAFMPRNVLRHYGRVLSEEALSLDFRGLVLGRSCRASIRSCSGLIGESRPHGSFRSLGNGPPTQRHR